MATYDDYEGVYFTIQALRMYHPELSNIDYEIIVLDNNPSSKHGKLTKDFINSYVKNGRYIEFVDYQSSFCKYHILTNAVGEIYVGIDCHVLLYPHFFTSVIEYFADQNNSMNILQGPLMMDCMSAPITHMNREWRGNMLGTWGLDSKKLSKGIPFEIPMHGMGMFACMKNNFPIIPSTFRAFGGEEGFIHDKFRQNGGLCICHPHLKWLHRFNRPLPVPFKNTYEDIFRNYIIQWHDIYKYSDDNFIADLRNTFSKFLSHDTMDNIIINEPCT